MGWGARATHIFGQRSFRSRSAGRTSLRRIVVTQVEQFRVDTRRYPAGRLCYRTPKINRTVVKSAFWKKTRLSPRRRGILAAARISPRRPRIEKMIGAVVKKHFFLKMSLSPTRGGYFAPDTCDWNSLPRRQLRINCCRPNGAVPCMPGRTWQGPIADPVLSGE